MERGNIYLSVGEEEIVAALQEQFNITELEAVEKVVQQKRELCFHYRRAGNIELAKQLTGELGEPWIEMPTDREYKKIII